MTEPRPTVSGMAEAILDLERDPEKRKQIEEWAIRIAMANRHATVWVSDARAARNCAGEEFVPKEGEFYD